MTKVRATDRSGALRKGITVKADAERPPRTLETEIEVTLTPLTAGGTRVDLEQRGLEGFGEGTEEMRAMIALPNGRGGTLSLFAATADG